MNCVDRLGAALGRLAQRRAPSAFRCDEDGKLRAIARPIGFAGIVGAAFNQIRQYGRDSVAVTIRLLEALATISRNVGREEDRAVVMHHATMAAQLAKNFLEESDRQEVQDRFDQLSAAR